jgi:exosortase A-associated hydrolase 1
VLLSRALAAAGYSTLRFDYRGMGDSTGTQRDFEAVSPDIGAAVDTLCAACPSVTKVVLWGLCDAAAASLLYLDETHDPRIAGLCLLNPWVRSETTLAKTQVKHYYGQRLLQGEFWLKLLSGRLNIVEAIVELVRKIGLASHKAGSEPRPGFQDRMARAWQGFAGRILLILSGDDFTAKEFLEYAAGAASWHGLLERANVSRHDVASADHTFSSREWRDTVQNACLDWLERYD